MRNQCVKGEAAVDCDFNTSPHVVSNGTCFIFQHFSIAHLYFVVVLVDEETGDGGVLLDAADPKPRMCNNFNLYLFFVAIVIDKFM